jgi:hypothetical protein
MFLTTLVALGAGLTGQAASVLPPMIPNNVSPTFTTGDGLFTIEGFSDSASTIPTNLRTGGSPSYFGVEANGALDNTDTMKLQFAPGVGFTGFGDISPQWAITHLDYAVVPDPEVWLCSRWAVLRRFSQHAVFAVRHLTLAL